LRVAVAVGVEALVGGAVAVVVDPVVDLGLRGIDARMRSVYVTNVAENSVSQYDVDAAGKLTPKTPETVTTGTQPVGLAMVRR
jgi:hypothetical protein